MYYDIYDYRMHEKRIFIFLKYILVKTYQKHDGGEIIR